MYYSTNGNAPLATLEKAVVKGLAEDRGLYMPERIARLPESFFEHIAEMDFHEVACAVAAAFFGEDIQVIVVQVCRIIAVYPDNPDAVRAYRGEYMMQYSWPIFKA